VSSAERFAPSELPPPAGYSHAVAVPAGARLVLTSGQVALDEAGHVVGEGDWEAQTEQAMRNLGIALAAAGAAWGDVVKLTIFVTGTEHLQVVRDVRDRYVDTTRPPASSLVQVAGLFRPDLLIEIEAVAVARS
jgi:enamine deaminase RidA (YjgF/YER057c/UK114 family)